MIYIGAVDADPVSIFLQNVFKLYGRFIIKSQIIKHQIASSLQEISYFIISAFS
jgi:hypothetical protein